MRDDEEGYATATMIALLTALSLVSASILSSAVTENKRADMLLQRAQVDGLLDQLVFREIHNLLIIKRRPEFQPYVTTLEGISFEIRTSDEMGRQDLNRDSLDSLRVVIGDQIDAERTANAFVEYLSSARQTSKVAFESIAELRAWPGFSSFEAACMSDKFSLYRSSINPMITHRREAQSFSLVGAILRIDARITTESGPQRGLQSIVLLTGDHRKPYRVMEWRRYSDYSAETCSPS